MLVIRREQIEAMSLEGERRFEDQAYRHLVSAVPERCAELGELAVRESIRTAIRKARGYGLETERDILHYLNVMYWLGHGFDEDPAYSWAQELLGNLTLEAETRAEWLVEAALAALAAEEKDTDVERS
jgi:hypothetical protein